MELQIGPYTLFQRTDYSKIQVLDEDGNPMPTKSGIGKTILSNYYKQKENPEKFFEIEGDTLKSYINDDETYFVFIPDNIRYIDACAFEGSTMSEIHLPHKLKYIEDNAFAKCLSLETVVFPKNFDGYIGHGIFRSCFLLEEIVLPENINKIPCEIFEFCTSLCNVNLPSTITQIGDCAFLECNSLNNIYLPDGITRIDDCAFNGCEKLTKINIPRDLTYIGNAVFTESAIKELIFNYDFKLSNSSPKNCYDGILDTITIKNTVNFIDHRIFGERRGAKEINYLGTSLEFENFKKNNKELFDCLSSAKVNILKDSNIEKDNKLSLEKEQNNPSFER